MNNDTPNATSTATTENAVASFESIASKMAAMRDQTQRNLQRATEQTETGALEAPVAPDGESQPEIAEPEAQETDAAVEAVAPEDETSEVTAEETTNSLDDELIDFIEFAETNPQAKFKFMKNGKEIIIDAKRAASILGQGGAIHEDARKLKIERSEFDEFVKDQRARQEGLSLAMEFTVEPKIQQAYDEIVRTQSYQTTFQQQLNTTQDAAEQARIRASMQQNERYITQQGDVIRQLKPAVDQFRQIRQQQVAQVLETNRRAFSDKELRNEYVYNELREKLSKSWPQSQQELIPGIKNLDLIASDETVLSLIRDGLKYRDRPTAKQAGASMAALTRSKGTTTQGKNADDNIARLREQAKGGDKKAADNLLMAQLTKIRAGRAGR